MKDGLYPGEKASGFTLIEMLVAMVIIGILVAVAIPSFSVWLPNYRLKSAAMGLFSDLQLAKMDAIRANGKYTVTFNKGGGFYRVEGPTGATVKTVSLSNYGSGIGYGRPGGGESVDYVGYKVTFTSRGMAENAGEVYLQNGKGRYYKIESTITGVIRVDRVE